MNTNQVNTIDDLGTVTKIPNKILTELTHKLNLCIGSAIHDAILNKEEVILLNVGIGTLSVSLTDMQCKFLPSKDLKTVIKNSINEKVDPLELELEDTLVQKLLSICDEAL